MPRTDMRFLMSLPAPFPPLPEQRQISDILNHADSIRRLRRQAEQKAREIIPALFVEMFGDPVRNPRRWNMQSLGELLERIDSGWSPKCGNRPAAGEYSHRPQ